MSDCGLSPNKKHQPWFLLDEDLEGDESGLGDELRLRPDSVIQCWYCNETLDCTFEKKLEVPDFAKDKGVVSGPSQDTNFTRPSGTEVFMEVIYKILGGQPKTQTVAQGSTVGQLKQSLGLGNVVVLVNRQEANDATVLANDDYVNFGEAVKGGC